VNAKALPEKVGTSSTLYPFSSHSPYVNTGSDESFDFLKIFLKKFSLNLLICLIIYILFLFSKN